MSDKKKTVCNQCGRELLCENGILHEDCVRVDKSWGYFSSKDGVDYHFVLCEACCDRLVSGFTVPVHKTQTIELL